MEYFWNLQIIDFTKKKDYWLMLRGGLVGAFLTLSSFAPFEGTLQWKMAK